MWILGFGKMNVLLSHHPEFFLDLDVGLLQKLRIEPLVTQQFLALVAQPFLDLRGFEKTGGGWRLGEHRRVQRRFAEVF